MRCKSRLFFLFLCLLTFPLRGQHYTFIPVPDSSTRNEMVLDTFWDISQKGDMTEGVLEAKLEKVRDVDNRVQLIVKGIGGLLDIFVNDVHVWSGDGTQKDIVLDIGGYLYENDREKNKVSFKHHPLPAEILKINQKLSDQPPFTSSTIRILPNPYILSPLELTLLREVLRTSEKVLVPIVNPSDSKQVQITVPICNAKRESSYRKVQVKLFDAHEQLIGTGKASASLKSEEIQMVDVQCAPAKDTTSLALEDIYKVEIVLKSGWNTFDKVALTR